MKRAGTTFGSEWLAQPWAWKARELPKQQTLCFLLERFGTWSGPGGWSKLPKAPRLVVDAKALYDLLIKEEVQARAGAGYYRGLGHAGQVEVLPSLHFMGQLRTDKGVCSAASCRLPSQPSDPFEVRPDLPSCKAQDCYGKEARSRDVCHQETSQDNACNVCRTSERDQRLGF